RATLWRYCPRSGPIIRPIRTRSPFVRREPTLDGGRRFWQFYSRSERTQIPEGALKKDSSMARSDDPQDGNGPGWRQRAVSKSLSAARSRAETRVQGLLDAAFALIDERGTTQFTIQEVVDRSKQSLRGFYQYF